MQYPTCRNCGAFVQWEGSRCLICGTDRAATPTDPSAATAPAVAGPPGPQGQPTPGPRPGWPQPGQPYPPPPGRRSKAPLILGAVGGLAVIAVIAAASFVYLGRDDGPAHPDEWDPRVEGLAAWVEDERELSFEQPVYVDFLTAAEYREEVTGDSDQTDEPSEAEAQEAEDAVAGLRALGLIEGSVDLQEASDELSDSGTLAFYDHQRKRIVVRGTELTPTLRVTLAHELTHVLQDQHFDLERLEELEGDDGALLRAVAEGDAERIEERYVDDLGKGDRKAYDKDQEDDPETVEKLEEKVPDILIAFFAAPYIFGDSFVSLLHQTEGDSGVDGALENPPTVDEHVFDPFTYIDDDQPDEDVPAPEVDDGAEELDSGDFGTLAWFLVLSQRIDPKVALRATDGWGGDEYVSYKSGDKVCTAIRFRGDTPEDTAEMADASALWVAAMPKDAATADRENDSVLLRSCDPGKEASLARDRSVSELVALPAFRNEVALAFLDEGADEDVARCIAGGLVDGLKVSQMTDETGAYFQTREYQLLLTEVVGSCRR